MIVTPGNVIRGTFERALSSRTFGNALHHLPSGPLLPGCRVPRVLVLDREDGSIRNISRERLLEAEIIVTNYHSLGDGSDPSDLLAKLQPDDIDFLVIDEAHIAAAASYQRLFNHFIGAHAVLMSACFRRLDGKPIEADIVYRYRLIDAITDGVAKNLMIHRHVADPNQIVYEVLYPDGGRSEVIGKENLLEIISDERKLPVITAKSLEPIRRVMAIVRKQLDAQTKLLYPTKPRVLFAALGEQHAGQIAQVAREFGIPCAHLHHTMGEMRLRRLRERFERDSGDLQGLVHLRMLGQGYDFPPITIVVPMRPYGSFAEFYQFVGRGIRILAHPDLKAASEQTLDIIFHSELGLEEHLEDLRNENDMEPLTYELFSDSDILSGEIALRTSDQEKEVIPSRPDVNVLTTPGKTESGVLHTPQQIERRQEERERDALAVAYTRYVESSPTPISFEEYLEIVRQMRHE
jgi:superfamily II DNA or RNA helicase